MERTVAPPSRFPSRRPTVRGQPDSGEDWIWSLLAQVTLVALFVSSQVWILFAFADIGPLGTGGRMTWDGGYYRILATDGYPAPLAHGVGSGDLKLYAFYPLYPLVVRALMQITSMQVQVVAPVVSVVCATAAVCLLVVWMRRRVGVPGAAGAVLGLVMWPASPVFQMAYTEGLAMLLLVGCLWALSERRYAWFVGAAISLSVTRALGLVIAVVALVHLFQCWRNGERGHRLRGPVVAAVAGVGCVAIWPVFAGFRAHDPTVYFTAHKSFKAPGTPMSVIAASVQYPEFAVLSLATLTVTTLVALKLLPETVPLPIRTFLVAYPLFILSTAIISTSLLRYFLFVAFPLGLALEPALKRRWLRWLVVVVALGVAMVGSGWWVREFVPPVADGTVPNSRFGKDRRAQDA